MDVKSDVLELGKRAKKASRALASLTTGVKNDALTAMAEALMANAEHILAANEKDIAEASAKGIGANLLDRLMLNTTRLKEIAEDLLDVAVLADPVGEVVKGWKVPNGLSIRLVRVPLGVVAMIYEARPNVTVDAAGLCLKSGNAVVLRGGSMAANSNAVLTEVISKAATGAGIPESAIQVVSSTSREAANELMRLEGYVDVLIPRGGPDLIKSVLENSRVPVLYAGAGNCHVYVDAAADLPMARRIVINAKCQRPSVCNAAETLLVHSSVADRFVPLAMADLTERGVEIRGDERVRALHPEASTATEEDWWTEFHELIMAIKVVDSLDEAIDHINTYGSGHSDAIVTESYEAARRFAEEIDSAAVYVNASTRFTDGAQFGMGAEIGISTQKLHARGPMGLQALTSMKYVVEGTGQTRE
ncbi:MAG: glutamate-5-semialdehyde dehydrogenase [Actinobacteria bacterium]|nr:glutamate-5-semialdehyde dehydrogenase [Actinomycetota bacterium]